MAKNGLLFVSNATKAHAVCQRASKYVQKTLYINFKESSHNTLPVVSREIVELYTKVINKVIFVLKVEFLGSIKVNYNIMVFA